MTIFIHAIVWHVRCLLVARLAAGLAGGGAADVELGAAGAITLTELPMLEENDNCLAQYIPVQRVDGIDSI